MNPTPTPDPLVHCPDVIIARLTAERDAAHSCLKQRNAKIATLEILANSSKELLARIADLEETNAAGSKGFEELRTEYDALRAELESAKTDITTAIEDCNRSRQIIYAMSAALRPKEGEHNIDCAVRVSAELESVKKERDMAVIEKLAAPEIDKMTVDLMWHHKSEADALRATESRLRSALLALKPCAHHCSDGKCPHDRRYLAITSEALALEGE